MAKQNINVGTSVNDRTGDSIRSAFQKVNANFTELYTALGLVVDANLNLGAFEFTGSVMSTTDSSAIVIDQAATITSNLSVGGDILPQTANGGDLGSSTLPWRSLYVSNNTIYIGGTAVGLDANGNLTVNGSRVGTTSYADLTNKPTGFSSLVNGANTVSLGSDGALTLPGGRTRIGTLLGTDAIIANEDTAFGVVAQGTNGAVQLVWIEDLENFYTSNLAAVYVNSGGPGSVRIATGANGGPGPKFWEFKNSGALTFPQGTTIATADGTDAFLIDGAVDKDVQIYTYSGATARGWTFGTDGSLRIPGDITSNGNINIEINLADSTLRRWQFGEDGELTLPAGGNISEGGGISGAIKLTPAGGANANQALLIYPTGTAEGDHIHLTAGGGSTELYLGDDFHFVKLTSDGFVVIKADDGVNGAVWGFSPDGTTSIPGDIKSDSNINIEINLSDSTLRRWQFGEDGVFTTGAIEVASETATIRLVDNQIGIVATASQSPHLILKGADTYGGDVYLYGGTRSGGGGGGGNIILSPETNDGGTYGETFIKKSWRANSDAWKFSRDGVFSLPPGGTLRFPDATVQSTAWTGSVAAGTLTGTALASGVVSSSLTSVGTLSTLAVTGAVTAETFNTDQITVVGNRISTTVTNANLEIECNGTGGVVINTVAEATTASTARSVGYLGIPASTVTTTNTLTIADAGEHIYVTTTGQTITIPAASSVAYPIGTTLTFIAGPSATTTTIAITSDTLRLAGGTSTGSRTLAANGMATAVKVSGTSSAGVWYINGIGLT